MEAAPGAEPLIVVPVEAGATDGAVKEEVPSTLGAGYIFLCRNATQIECLEKRVFGLSERALEGMQTAITDATQIYLLNMHSGALIGTFQPVGMPGLNLDPEAFEGGFPAQVKVMPIAQLTCVKINQKLNAGPKTAEEVTAIQAMFAEGEPVDPLAVEEEDKGYGQQFPRGKAMKASKGYGKGKGKWYGYGKGPGMGALWNLAYGGAKGWGKGQPREVDESGGVLGEFTGTIKSFVDSKWYGFIECPEVQALGHQDAGAPGKQDVFLHGDQKRGYQVGHKVKFTAVLNKDGKVGAKDLKSGLNPGEEAPVAPDAADAPAPAPYMVSA